VFSVARRPSLDLLPPRHRSRAGEDGTVARPVAGEHDGGARGPHRLHHESLRPALTPLQANDVAGLKRSRVDLGNRPPCGGGREAVCGVVAVHSVYEVLARQQLRWKRRGGYQQRHNGRPPSEARPLSSEYPQLICLHTTHTHSPPSSQLECRSRPSLSVTLVTPSPLCTPAIHDLLSSLKNIETPSRQAPHVSFSWLKARLYTGVLRTVPSRPQSRASSPASSEGRRTRIRR
jgi:hypothetical protein